MTLVLPMASGQTISLVDDNNVDNKGWLLTEPSPIRLDSSRLCLLLALLKGSGLDNLTVAVPNGLAAIEHLDTRRRFCITVKVFACGSVSAKCVSGRREGLTFYTLESELAGGCAGL